jgi:hypothetical protein
MKRVPVYIDDDVEQLLRKMAKEERETFNSLVRDALAEYLQRRGVTVRSRIREPQASITDPEIRERFLRALENIRAGIPDDMTQEELDAEIDAAVAEVRAERWQQARQPVPTHD